MRRGIALTEPLLALLVLAVAVLPLVAGLQLTGRMTRQGRAAGRILDCAESTLDRVAASGGAGAFATEGPAADAATVTRVTELEPGLSRVELCVTLAAPGAPGMAPQRFVRLISDPTIALRSWARFPAR